MAKASSKPNKILAKKLVKSRPTAVPARSQPMNTAANNNKLARKPPARGATKNVAKSLPAAKSGKWVYSFGDGRAEGKAGMKELLGGKGANLAEMANLGLPVPPGFTIPTSVCAYFYANEKPIRKT